MCSGQVMRKQRFLPLARTGHRRQAQRGKSVQDSWKEEEGENCDGVQVGTRAVPVCRWDLAVRITLPWTRSGQRTGIGP